MDESVGSATSGKALIAKKQPPQSFFTRLRSSLKDAVYLLCFSETSSYSPVQVREYRNTSSSWLKFFYTISLHCIFWPCVLGFSSLFFPMPTKVAHIRVYQYPGCLAHTWMGTFLSGMIPPSLGMLLLEDKDIVLSRRVLIPPLIMTTIVTLVLLVVGSFIFPIPFAPVLLGVPGYIAECFVLFKTEVFYSREFLNQPGMQRRINLTLMLAIFCAGGFIAFVMFNFVFNRYVVTNEGQILLALCYPFFKLTVRFVPNKLTKLINEDRSLEMDLFFEFMASTYNQLLFMYINGLPVFFVLQGSNLIEQLSDIMKFTKTWRNIRKTLKHHYKITHPPLHFTSDDTVSQNIFVTAAPDTDIINTASFSDLPCIPGGNLPQTLSEPLLLKLDSQAAMSDTENSLLIPAAAAAAESGPSSSHRNLRQYHSQELVGFKMQKDSPFPEVTVAPPEHLSSDMVVPVSFSSRGSRERLLVKDTSGVMKNDAKRSKELLSVPLNSVAISSSVNTLDSVMLTNSLSESHISSRTSSSGNFPRPLVVKDAYRGKRKRVPFILEAHYWNTSHSLSIQTLFNLVAPITTFVLVGFVYGLPYNFGIFKLSDDVSIPNLLVNLVYSAMSFGIELVTFVSLFVIIKRQYGIDIRVPVIHRIRKYRGFVAVMLSSVLVGTHLINIKYMGFDFDFQFPWLDPNYTDPVIEHNNNISFSECWKISLYQNNC